jgi:glycosyltransferase involved in cell wall biosynthesis
LDLISIILPVYNRQEYIERAIVSVLNQIYKKWELIIIDDGSNDSTAELIGTYKNYDPRIKTFYQNHQNLSTAKNNGISRSEGKFITFLDSDDEYKKEHLKFRIDFLNQNPKAEFLHGGVQVIGNQFVPDRNDRTKLTHLSSCAIGATFFGRREIFLELDGFKQIDYSEDSEFLERVIKYYNVRKVDFPTYIYHRELPDSITKNGNLKSSVRLS